MNSYKNSEIAEKYSVSNSTVTEWIKASKEGKNNLLLEESRGKYRVLNNQHNLAELTKLKELGEKYRPTIHIRKIKPEKKMYKIFNSPQISEIITSLETFHEIPHKYSYFSHGARAWHEYVQRSFSENLINTVTNTSNLLQTSLPYFLEKLSVQKTKCNLVDVGVGDAQTIQPFLSYIYDCGLLENYIAIDISQSIFEIAEKNINTWFKSPFPFKKYLRDINKESLQDVLFYSSNSNKSDYSIKNLVLFLETTLENQRDYDKTLLNLKDSIGQNDLLVLMQTIDSKQSRVYFDLWNKENTAKSKIPDQVRWIPEMLGISQDMYRAEFLYDEEQKTRFIQLRLLYDTEIEFGTADFCKVVSLRKNDPIIVWRHSHHSLQEITAKLSQIGLDIDYMITSQDKAQVMLCCYVVD